MKRKYLRNIRRKDFSERFRDKAHSFLLETVAVKSCLDIEGWV